MKATWVLAGLLVLAAGCDRQDAAPPADAAQTPLSTVHLVTALSDDDNVKLREGVMTLAEGAPADAPPVLLVMAEMSSPAFNFHVQGDCASAAPYVEGLIKRSAAAAALTMNIPDIGCVEVNPGAAGS
ncbi:MAG: hypothetical protein EOP62_24040 [Sphingomonadales bacterium]|nr:MAG: hypothetical protein EOP62_24040 [Sphingomonadales bacterium]